MAPADAQLLQHIDRRLSDFAGRVEARFDGLDREMKDVKEDIREVKRQTTMTNGRVNAHDSKLAGIKPRLEAVINDVDELKAIGHSPQKLEEMLQSAVSSITAGLTDMKGKVTIEAQSQTGDARRLTRWDAMIFCAGGGAVWALIKFVEWAVHSLRATP